MTARHRVLAAVLLVSAVVAGGCASIPGDTLPQPADLQGGALPPRAAPPPPRNDGPLNIVRGFIDSSGDATNRHAAARAYLADSARNWNSGTTPSSVFIIGDVFSTNNVENDSTDPNTKSVVVHGQLVGTLTDNGEFQPPQPSTGSDFEQTMGLHRQSDGQWRIVDPPGSLVITQQDFARYYRPVTVYFFDPSLTILVPDPRYVISDPVDGLPGRIVDLLLGGPSTALHNAVADALPADASLKTNVETADGVIHVNFKSLSDQPSASKQLMVAQLVQSLKSYGTSVSVQSEGVALVPGHQTWRATDLPNYEPYSAPNAPPLVVTRGRIESLVDATPLPGPAGNGTYVVATAAESMDGQEIATVTAQPGGGEVLRVGGLKTPADPVKDVAAASFTRPTWAPSDSSGGPSRAVWTVADGVVTRVVLSSTGASWVSAPVDASALEPFGPITDLRLSRDGVRVAVVAGGHLLVGSVVIANGSAMITQVRVLLLNGLTTATRVDWLDQDLLVVATGQPASPVQSVSVDGQKQDSYNSANLTSPVTEIAATPTPQVLAVDNVETWYSRDINDIWQPYPHDFPAGSVPFYPG